ncbi:hypothetical protein CC79DRAFT_157568 [Sarocladium strictum]
MLAGCNAASVAGGNTAPVLWRGSTGRFLGYINFSPFLSLIGIRRRRSWFASWLLTVRAALLCLPEQSLAETTVKHENMFLFHFLEPPPKHPLHTIVRNGTWSFCSASDTYRIRSNARSGLRRHRLVWGIWLQSIRQIHSGIGGRRRLGPLILEDGGHFAPLEPSKNDSACFCRGSIFSTPSSSSAPLQDLLQVDSSTGVFLRGKRRLSTLDWRIPGAILWRRVS